MAMTNIGKLVAFAMSCFLIIFGFPGQSVGISALTESILDTTGMSRNLFSTIYMISMLVAGILSLVGGVLIGKIGIKRSVMFSLFIWILELLVKYVFPLLIGLYSSQQDIVIFHN